MITKPPGSSESRNYPKLLASTLGNETWSAGDELWDEKIAAAPDKESRADEIAPLAADNVARAPRRTARRTSERKKGVVRAAEMFALEDGRAAATGFGSAVHALLAEVEWGDAADFGPEWTSRGEPIEAVAEALGCLRATELAGVRLHRDRAEVWRERAFELVLDDDWVTGGFDRVVIDRGVRGRAEAVTVFDFKTDRIVDEAVFAEGAKRHAAQLNLHRRGAAGSARVPIERVACELTFTQMRRRVRVYGA